MGDGYFRHTPTLLGSRTVRALSIDDALISHVSELVAQLAREEEWLEVGDSVEDVVAECWLALDSWYGNMMVGAISQFMGPVPDGWLPLDGSTYDAADYPELWEQLDVVFKNVPAETFTLPDCYDRVIAGSGGSLGLGSVGGASSVALSVAELPAHNHTYVPPVLNIDLEGPGVPDVLAAGVGTPTTTSATGAGDAHENMPPYVALWFAVFAGRA